MINEIELQHILQNKYDDFDLSQKKLVHELYHKEEIYRTDLYNTLHNIVFRLDPPSPLDFLDPRNGWLSKLFVDSLYSHVIDDFLEITDKEKNYNQIIEYGGTRIGKSHLARLIIMYTIIFTHCLRHPQLYYGLAPTTMISIYMMCFKAEKIKQILLKPLYQFLEISPRFERIKFERQVKEKQYKYGLDTIYWSSAATFGEITLDSDLTINLGIDFMSFLGADMLMMIVSEIAFFIENQGATHEKIFQIYSDGLDRIKATIKNNYLGLVYLDTSANDAENPIENYVLNELQKQKRVFFRKRSRWEAMPFLFPKWQKTGETFKVFTGSSTHAPKILREEDSTENLDTSCIIDVPIDVEEEFERNLTKSIKDIAGRPTVKENKLITDFSLISNIFTSKLKNIDKMLIAESSDIPDDILWNYIHPIFFTEENDKKVIIRAPNEIRFLGSDLSYSQIGDVQGICLLHLEWSRILQTVMYIIDFCFPVGSIKTQINLEALTYFIQKLVEEGNLAIKQVYSDSFQSQTMIQYLQRHGIDTIKQSVDRTINPYQFLLTCLFNNTLKGGYNPFLKNNLNSLIIIKDKNDKPKIDHRKGETNNIYDGNWEYSTCGQNAKDVSDAVCHAVWGAKNFEYIPATCFEDENLRLNPTVEYTTKAVDQAWKKIHKIY